MRRFINLIINNPLVSGSAVILIGTNIGNFFHFLFTLFYTSTLPLGDIGTVTSLVSLINLNTLLASAAIPMIVKFAASYFAQNENARIKGLFIQVNKLFVTIGIIAIIAFTFLSKQLGAFFNIQQHGLLILVGITISVSYLGVISGAFLQAKLSFKYITLVNFMGALVKFVSGVALIYIGFAAIGAIGAYLLSFLMIYILTLIPLRFLFSSTIANTGVRISTLIGYGVPATLTLFSLTSLVTMDLILVKHFFNPQVAGAYAVLSIVGKIIFFFTAPVGTVMFPLLVQKYAKGKEYHKDFRIALILVLIPSVLLTLFYYLFPQFVISFFNKEPQSIAAAKYLGIFGVFITVYSLLYIITNFYLAINKTKVYIPITLAAFFQIVLIWLFHNSFGEVIIISLVISVLLLLVLLLYYLKLYGEKVQKD